MNKEQEKIYKELILKYKFTNRQKEEIKLGLEQNLDVSFYSNPEFTHDQMKEIRLGLEKGLNISWYAKPEFDWGKMSEIRRALENKLDLSWYNSNYNVYQLIEIIRSQNEGFDYKILLDPKLQPFEMRELRTNKVKFYYYKLKHSFSK